MLQLIDGLSRIGDENAFAVLARAQALADQGRDYQPWHRTAGFFHTRTYRRSWYKGAA